jgi:hypothetical protein
VVALARRAETPSGAPESRGKDKAASRHFHFDRRLTARKATGTAYRLENFSQNRYSLALAEHFSPQTLRFREPFPVNQMMSRARKKNAAHKGMARPRRKIENYLVTCINGNYTPKRKGSEV